MSKAHSTLLTPHSTLRASYLVALLALLLCACEGDYPYSRRYACSFMMKQQTHPTSL